LKPSPEIRASERVAGTRDIQVSRIGKGLMLNPLLNQEDLFLSLRFDDDLGATGWAGEITGLIITANHLPGSIRKDGEVSFNDLSDLFILNAFKLLNGARSGLQESASRSIAVSKGTIQNRLSDQLSFSAIPYFFYRVAL
jgi:hypothetical protein